MENLSGTNIKGYELRERIGAGGFGTVYRAYQSSVGREVAIKMILPHFANHPDFIRRFEAEAGLVARLEHPHIIPLHDYWRDASGAYLVMRWLRGGSLSEALKDGPYTLQASVLLLAQITSALSLAHRNSVIHRDLKPANILLDEDGNAYVADFGIAKDLNRVTANATQADAVVGSPDYLSPEQARSEPVSPQTDIYSLGVLLYEVLTGQHPFPDATPIERLYKHLNDPLPRITILSSDVADSVNAVVQKATAKNPAHRYSDVLDMATAFQEATKLHRQTDGDSVVEILTQREQEVLQRIIGGQSNKQIAQALVITVATVKWYVNQIYSKLHVRNRVQAIVRARELNLITNEPTVLLTGVTAVPTDQFAPKNPYKGLRPFQAADSQDFFGREALTDKLVKRLGETGEMSRFLAVIGPSGSGKSSLVKAGLIPALWRGTLPDSERWFVAEMLPGSHPLDELEITLTRVAANPAGNLREQLQRDERGLLRVAQLILPNDGSQLVLVIDQFEEVFTLVEDEKARVHFLNLIREAITDPRSRVRVVVTLRADFYDRPLLYPDFGELVRSRMETVLPLTADGLEQAITRPAERVGLTFEPGLIATIVSEVNYQPGALPLLQYALTELFDRRQGRVLTHAAYQEIGGTVGALARRADGIYEGLDTESQEATHQMFLRLVTLGEGVEDTRRRVPRSELMAIATDTDTMDDIIDTFTAYRLLSLDHDPATRSPTVEVAHEAILREWQRLREWLNESRHDIRLQRLLGAAAVEWFRAKRDDSFLLRGSRLQQFQTWATDTKLALTPQEQEYLDASLAERERQTLVEQKRQKREAGLERRSRNILRGLVGVLAVATAVAVILTLIATRQGQIAVSRELAAAAVNNLQVDPERSVLLTLQALATSDTLEAQNALHQSLPELHILRTIVAHDSAVTGVTFSPDGTRIATTSADKTAKVWNAENGALLLTLKTDDVVWDAAYSPDGKLLATSGFTNVTLWDAATGQKMFTLVGQTVGSTLGFDLGVGRIRFNPDGTRLAVANQDGVPKVWDLSTHTEILSLKGHKTICKAIAYSPDGKLLATGSDDGMVKLWDAQTGQELLTLTGHTSQVRGLTLSPEGKRLVSVGEDARLVVWDVVSGRELLKLTNPSAGGFRTGVFTRDGKNVVVVGYDGTAKVWDAASGQLIFTLAGHTSTVLDVAFSPDGMRLVTVSADQTLRIWDPGPGRELLTLTGHIGSLNGSLYSPDGTKLATASEDGTVKIWDPTSGRLLRTMSPAGQPHPWGCLAYSADGQRLATGSMDGVVSVWDAVSGIESRVLTGHTNYVRAIAFSPDGKRLATASLDGTAKVWDLDTGQVVVTFKGHIHPEGTAQTNSVWSLSFSPDGRRVATGGFDQVIRVWDATSGQELLTLPAAGNALILTGLAFSPDGKLVAGGQFTGLVVVWDATTGKLLRTLAGHSAAVVHVAFSSDGTRLVSASFDKLAKVWDVQTGQEIASLYGNASNVATTSFSPDGKHVATGGADATARIFTLQPDDLVTLARSRVTRSLTLNECQKYLHRETCP